ncbi:MAG: 2,3-bisphosphoglycerate-independent phosphoglycerate mutase [Patescibacteria group bacterium]
MSKPHKQTITLLILDGWGIGANNPTNPIHIAQPKNIQQIKNHYLGGNLQASGIAVGLPWNEEGNSEVGHLTIGAGKTIYQNYPRITLAIQSGEFAKNKIFLDAFEHAKKNNSSLHLIGLLSEGNVHASLTHLTALIDLAKKHQVAQIKLDLISDGRDSPPQSVLQLLEKLKSSGVILSASEGPSKDSSVPPQNDSSITIASLSGRYFAMDRDRHWDRAQEYYNTLLGKKESDGNITKHIKTQYEHGLNDQYLEPISIDPKNNAIKNNDAVIFFNFREDRMRQLTAIFLNPDFKEFATAPIKNLHIATMVQYSDQFKTNVAFPPEKIALPLGKVLADNNKLQLRVAETEKYAHVTYFFNGLKDKPAKNEYRILIPSKNIVRHEEHPEMMAAEITDRVIQAIEEGEMDFILANLANPDMIAHTGDFNATVTAIKVVDEQVGKILQATIARDAVLIITSDHGNAERMLDPLTGHIETKHDTSPVPFYLVGKRFERKSGTEWHPAMPVGVLSDIAPTILDLMKIPKPAEMTGESLLKRLL